MIKSNKYLYFLRKTFQLYYVFQENPEIFLTKFNPPKSGYNLFKENPSPKEIFPIKLTYIMKYQRLLAAILYILIPALAYGQESIIQTMLDL